MSHLIPTIERTAAGDLVVTSETVATGAGVQHKNVLELVATHEDSLGQLGQVAFQTRPGYNNAQVRIALLNEQQATLVLALMRNTDAVVAFKVALVKAFFAMAQQLAATPALTDDQIVHQALQITARKVEQLEAKVAEDAPKVAYVDTYVADEDLLRLRTVAADLGIGEDALRKVLLDRKWIYVETSSRWSNSKGCKEIVRRYSAFADKKPYFRPVARHEAPRFKGEAMHTLKVTPAGAAAIARNLARWTSEEAAA